MEGLTVQLPGIEIIAPGPTERRSQRTGRLDALSIPMVVHKNATNVGITEDVGAVLVKVTYHPWWRAEARHREGGEGTRVPVPIPVIHVAPNFMAVAPAGLAPGEHHVILRYKPPAYFVAGMALLFAVLLPVTVVAVIREAVGCL